MFLSVFFIVLFFIFDIALVLILLKLDKDNKNREGYRSNYEEKALSYRVQHD